MENNITKGSMIYYARAISNNGIYDVLELKVRTINNDDPKNPWYVGTYRSGFSFFFTNKNIGVDFFLDRKDALYKVKEAEKHGRHFNKSNENNEDDDYE